MTPEGFVNQKTELVPFERISQSVISSSDLKFSKRVYAFTEQGVAMLSGVLNSPQAVRVNVAIMRAFVRLRDFFASQTKLGKKLWELEQRTEKHDESIRVLFEAIHQLTSERPSAIGFQNIASEDSEFGNAKMVKEPRARYTVSRKSKQRRPTHEKSRSSRHACLGASLRRG